MAEDFLEDVPVTYKEWRIRNAIDQFKQNNPLDGPIFKFNDATWFLRIYPHGRMSDGKISLYLFREGLESEHVFFRIGVEANGVFYKQFEKKHSFTVGSNNCGVDDILKHKKFKELCIKNRGTLVIFCIIRVIDEATSTKYESLTLESKGTVPLTEDYRLQSDVRITVKGSNFQTRPALLAERSKFFARKLRDYSLWLFGRPIELDDCDPDTFNEFLEFMRSRDVDIVTSNNMVGLYRNSSVCEYPELKAVCRQRIEQDFSIDMFCDIHSLSIMKNETNFLNFVTHFFIDNAKIILESVKWQEHFKSNHLRCNELFFKFLTSRGFH